MLDFKTRNAIKKEGKECCILKSFYMPYTHLSIMQKLKLTKKILEETN